MKTNSVKTNRYLIMCPIEVRFFFENSFLINYIVDNCMKSRIRWIVGLCSIPLILLTIMPQSNIDCTVMSCASKENLPILLMETL